MTCKPHDHRHCLELFSKLSEYIDREMDEAELREVDAHVTECLACLSCLQSLKQTIALCKQTGLQPVPAVFSRKLHSMVQDLQRSR
jgi:anti-sigma factor RsiW